MRIGIIKVEEGDDIYDTSYSAFGVLPVFEGKGVEQGEVIVFFFFFLV